GVVAMGSVTVLINNMPAARQGDTIVEAGPPNTIVVGCPTVLIG
ncbi:MAG: PAAR domain-containing protein, partial [Anaerolineae bacterium]|nr:PAAR domain-containing protein [Anaerolineae bacterium]